MTRQESRERIMLKFSEILKKADALPELLMVSYDYHGQEITCVLVGGKATQEMVKKFDEAWLDYKALKGFR
jgi:hypothetical protein